MIKPNKNSQQKQIILLYIITNAINKCKSKLLFRFMYTNY